MAKNSFTYKTITTDTSAEYSDRGSKFIAYAFTVETIEEIKANIKKLKELHPKAVHHCYAYRIGYDNTQYRANDDGEPSGSAGRPILGQIDSIQITNVLVVVVRYFGGVLLGVPGLINAYKSVTQIALSQSGIIEKNRLQYYALKFDYTQMNDIMRVIKSHTCTIKSQSLTLFCEMNIGIAMTEEEEVLKKLSDVQGLEISNSGV